MALSRLEWRWRTNKWQQITDKKIIKQEKDQLKSSQAEKELNKYGKKMKWNSIKISRQNKHAKNPNKHVSIYTDKKKAEMTSSYNETVWDKIKCHKMEQMQRDHTMKIKKNQIRK